MRTGTQHAGIRNNGRLIGGRSFGRRRRVALAVAAVVPAVLSTSAFAADYIYTGGGAGTAGTPVTGNFSTGFTPAVSGATNGDVLRFNGALGVTYTATNDVATPIVVNGFRIDGTANVTINRSASSLIQLGGSNPFINFNNQNGTLTPPTIRNNFEFTQSGYIVKSSNPSFAYTPVFTGGTLTLDAGTNNIMSLADTGGDTTAEFNISSAIAGSGNVTLQDNATLPNVGAAGIATQVDTSAWGTVQLGNNPAYTGNWNIAFGRVVTGASNPFGTTGTLTIAIGATNTSGGSLTLGGTLNNGNGGHTAGDGAVGAYGQLANGSTGIAIPNPVNLGGAINGVYGYAINNFNGRNTLSGPINLTQTQIRIQTNSGNVMTSNAGSGLTFSGNVTESAVGAAFNVSGNGDLTFSGANNTFTGGINISGGLLTFTQAGSLPTTGTIYMNPGAVAAPATFASVSAALTSGRISNVSTGVYALSANDSNNVDFAATGYANMGVGAVTGSTVTYSGTITPGANGIRVGGGGGTLNLANPLTQAATLTVGYGGAVGVVTLTGTQSYTGGTNLSGGYLAVTSGQIPATSQITGLGGGIRLLDGAMTDFPATRNIIDQGGFSLDTNGFNVTLNSPVVAGGTGTTYGAFVKAGAGTLTVANTLNINNLFVNNNGAVVFNGPSANTVGHAYDSIGQFPGDNVTVTFDNGVTFTNSANDFNITDVAGRADFGAATDSATVNILNTNSATPVTQVSAGAIYVGKGSDTARSLAVGVVNQGPNTLFTGTGLLWVGGYGQGTYNQTGGTVSIAGNLTIGRYQTAVGVYNISGGTLNTSAGNIFVAEDGSGTLNISGAATTVLTNRLVVARGTDLLTGTVAVVNQSGGTVTTTGAGSTGGVLFGAVAGSFPASTPISGTYNLNGGVLKTGSISQTTNSAGAIKGTFNFNGGTVQASTGVATPFISGLTAANILPGGAIIDNNGLAITLAQNFAHGGVPATDGGLKLLGTGVVTVSSTGSTYTGPTQITAGTLRLAATQTSTVTLPTANLQAYWKFEDPTTNNSDTNQSFSFTDSSPNNSTLFQQTDTNSNPIGNAKVVTTSAPPSGPTTGTHTGSLALNSSAFLTSLTGNTPTNVPIGNQAYTIAAWIDGSGNANPNAYGIVGWGTYGTGNLVNAIRTTGVGGGTGNGLRHYWWANDLDAAVPGTGLATVVNQWHYVVATYDPTTTTRSIYADGVLVGRDSPTGHNASSVNFAVGVTNNFSEFFDGNMADMTIYDAAFSQGQAMLSQQLSGANSLSGSLTTTTPGGQIPITTLVQISAGAVFDLNGNSQTIGGLTGPTGGSVTLGGGNLTVNPAVSGEFDGVISGNGNLAVGGSAPLILGGVNTFNGSTTVAAGATLAITGAGRLTTGSNLTTAGTVSFQASAGSTINQRRLGAISVTAGSVTVQPALTHAGRTLLINTGVTVANSASFDLTNNDMVVTGGSLSAVTALAAKGFNGGAMNGAGGIMSSTAAADATHTTALGVIQNNQGGTPIYNAGNQFAGYTPGAADILVKYTYFGDANLDGKVDGSDYTRIDNGFITAGSSGWYNGDFNYDNKVDGSDYSLIDNAYNRQGAQISTPTFLIASPTALSAGSSAVPEPVSAVTVLLAGSGLLARRRRR